MKKNGKFQKNCKKFKKKIQIQKIARNKKSAILKITKKKRKMSKNYKKYKKKT